MTLVNNISKFISSLLNPAESFQDTARSVLPSLIELVIVLLIVLFLGKFLWNKVGCKYVTIFKPVNSIWEILALLVLFSMLHS